MRICLIQCNAINGDLVGNSSRMIDFCRRARDMGADLCIAPFAALCGPQASGYENFPDFGAACRTAAGRIAESLKDGPALLCGLPTARQAAMLALDGSLTDVPQCFSLNGCRLQICNWQTPPDDMDCDLLADMSCRAFAPGLQEGYEKRLKDIAAGWNVWAAGVNLAGGFDCDIYGGRSVVFDPYGRLAARGGSFAEDLVFVDTRADQGSAPVSRNEGGGLEDIWNALVLGLRDFIRKSGAKKALLGLSGGMDSALVACLAVEALGPEHVTGVLMPSPYSSEGSVTDAADLAANLNMETVTLPIEKAMLAFSTTLENVFEKFPARSGDLTFENLQARIRGILLMALANRTGALVLNTGNKSEAAMGYCTLYGDTAGALAVIGDLYKTEVYDMARWYCQKKNRMLIPQNIFDKPPSAELRPGQKDTDSLPPYEKLDPLLERLLACDAAPDSDAARIRRRALECQFKRLQSPGALRVSKNPLASLRWPVSGKLRLPE